MNDDQKGDATWQMLVEAAAHHRKAREAIERAKNTGNRDYWNEAQCEERKVWILVQEAKGSK